MRRTCSLVAIALLALGLTAPGADAAGGRALPDHARVHDRAGDAPAGADLLAGKYSISKRQARFSARVRDLTDTTFLAYSALAAARYTVRATDGDGRASAPSSGVVLRRPGAPKLRLTGHRLRHDPRAIATLLGWLARQVPSGASTDVPANG